jgi:hypothetical protein
MTDAWKMGTDSGILAPAGHHGALLWLVGWCVLVLLGSRPLGAAALSCNISQSDMNALEALFIDTQGFQWSNQQTNKDVDTQWVSSCP